MYCIFCQHPDTKVIATRVATEGLSVRRRRECPKCNARFTTFESVEIDLPQVIKRDLRREPFDASKIKSGLVRALEKRPVSVIQIDKIMDIIIQKMRQSGEKEITTRQLGTWMLDQLRGLDEVAYVRFASVYLSFQDLNAFRMEIERLEKQRHLQN
jgi:transcriptional repressor NrdR